MATGTPRIQVAETAVQRHVYKKQPDLGSTRAHGVQNVQASSRDLSLGSGTSSPSTSRSARASVSVDASFRPLDLKNHRGTQFLILHHPAFLALHFLPNHLPNLILSQIVRRLNSVAKTATTTLTKVMLEHRQLKGRARSSHLSRHPKGQISSVFMGARMPNG